MRALSKMRAASGLLPCSSVGAYTAADFSDGMLSVARANLGDRATIVHADATALPFEDGSFDRYVSNLGVCCTSDLTAKLNEARNFNQGFETVEYTGADIVLANQTAPPHPEGP